jgi:hypothetical protein
MIRQDLLPLQHSEGKSLGRESGIARPARPSSPIVTRNKSRRGTLLDYLVGNRERGIIT